METRVYAARLSNEQELLKSSSGGAFYAISDVFLKKNCAIVSAIYNYSTSQTEFKLYTSEKERNEARGSKYMQSMPLNAFREAEDWLKNNAGELLFVGMGCQADGFRKFAETKGFRDRVTIVDIICHGSPSPKLWREYADTIGDFSNLRFRDKRNGWRNPTGVVDVKGFEHSIWSYTKIFYNRCALRPACYTCPYATTKRKVDITIGDFWGVERALPTFEIGHGVSLILVHTDRGMNVWEQAKAEMVWEESNVQDCLQPNLVKPTEKSELRDAFWADYRSKGIKYIIRKYGHDSFITKVKGKIQKILFG